MGDYDQVGNAVVSAFKAMFIGLCVFVPLGLWKLIEIVIWLVSKVEVTFK